ncbi:fructosamine kinase family protein [Roseiconus lacunae]|uniref:Fructosamine kinase family protein n=1 Tax=Roseiconus lacunae TaxID=2605694 RepID=A0ABT7PN45_9BACT|nr:fructosamine kinase family protein [Roseiconus lacunae]MDM4017898.1 fructosamine kinase family protein [Roseiconus lacunae]
MRSSTLSKLIREPVEVIESRPLGGGCVSDVQLVTLKRQVTTGELRTIDGGVLRIGEGGEAIRIVVKQHSESMLSNFQSESEGLLALSATETIRVPRPIALGAFDQHALLALEWIDASPVRPSAADFERFGEQLADMHLASQSDRLGWERDNFLGAAPQVNQPTDDWVSFFAERRLRYQIRWAVRQGLADRALVDACDSIVARLNELLRGREKALSLLHGDLWSGNYLFGTDGRPALIDPAVYRGCREAEWGMIRWFGQCPPAFQQGYERRWPLPDGWQRRAQVYMLYHQLNHLNLFGRSYHGSCLETATAILRH